MKLIRDEGGQTLVFTALLACCLMGFMALAIDIGVLFRAQRKLQTAADAAAVAAALADEYSMNISGCGTGVSSIKCAAYKAAANNSVTDTTQIAVNNPPTGGSHTGATYIEVIIRQPNPTVFMGTFAALFPTSNTNWSTMTVAARAVAGIVPGQACVYALDGTADDALDVQGAANITVPNCTLVVNSASLEAVCSTGGATINAQGIEIVGAQHPNNKCKGTQANATTGVTPVANPLAGLPSPSCLPTPGGATLYTVGGNNPQIASATQLKNGAGATVNFSPTTVTIGTGPTATTASVVCFGDTNLTIANGVTLGSSQTAADGSGKTVGGNEIFVFNQGVKLGGAVTIWGTMDIAGGDFVQGNNALTLAAPANTASTYNGVGLMVPASNPSVTCGNSIKSFKGTPAPGGCLQVQFGSGSGNLDGMIYAPADQVYMQDNGGGTVVSAIIADEIYDKSSSLVITNNYNYVHTSSPLDHVALVE